MCKKLKASLFILLLSFSASRAHAQFRPEQLGELKFMLGKWAGEGWDRYPLGPQPSKIRQSATLKAGGWAILIEGLGTTSFPGRSEEFITYEAFTVISYDWREKQFHIHAFRGIEGMIDGIPKVDDGRLIWEYPGTFPNRNIRIIIKLNSKGQWYETEEESIDGGKTWQKVFEMTLNRVP